MAFPIRSRGLILVLLLAALAAPASTCLAGRTLWGVGAFGSYNTYAMSDVNDEIDAINVLLELAGLSPMDNVKSGIGYGGGLRAIFSDKVMVSLDYERLTGDTSVTDGVDRLEYDLPCDAVLATVAYRFPGSGKARFGLGGGLGYYSSAASISVDAASIGESVTGDITGSGIGFHGVGLVDVALSPAVHLEAQAGYRYGKTGDVSIEAAGLSQEIPDYSLDWSGFMSRVGLAIYFGAGK
jgi:hypothetical protein